MVKIFGLIIFTLLLNVITAVGQKKNDLAIFNQPKYSLIFGDHVQVLYNDLNLKKVTHDFFLAGDKAFYNGNYVNAASRYLTATQYLTDQGDHEGELVIGIGTRRSGKDIMKGPLSQLTLYGRLRSTNMEDLDFNKKQYYASILTAVGIFYQTRANYERADEFLTLAADLRADLFGETSPEYISSLHNLAVLKKNIGDYEEAEKLFSYLLPVSREIYLPDAPAGFATILNNYAMLQAELGRTKLALEHLDEALLIGRQHFSTEYIDYERLLTNKAMLLLDDGQPDLADQFYREALNGMEQKGFQNHPNYNIVLIYYGAFRILRDEANVASFLNDVEKSIRRRYGKKHPLYAHALNNQADYHMRQNRFDLARPILINAKNTQLQALGSKHKDYLQTLNKLGVCQWYLKDISNARQSFDESINGYLFYVNTFFNSLSETEKGNLWRTMKPAIDNYMAFATDNASSNETILADAFKLHLQTKGLLINSTLRTRQQIANSGDSNLVTIFAEYQAARQRLAIYYTMTLDEINDDKIDLKDLESRVNELERELSTKTEFIAVEKDNLTYEDIRVSLDSDEAAVEIIRIPVNYGPDKGQVKYAMLIAKKESPRPGLVVIHNGLELEGKHIKFYKNTIQLRIANEESYKHYWDPVAKELEGFRKLYVSLDGVYNNINLNTLKSPDNGYLVDHVDVTIVPNTTAILALKTEKRTFVPGRNAALFGYPDFGNEKLIDPLPGTKDEVLAIKALLSSSQFNTEVFLEEAASEAQFVKLSRPGLLHVATHGFFLPDVDRSANMVMGTNVSKAKDNPLLRSGLLLSGAAGVFDENPRLNSGFNGVVNAFKVMNLDLTGTEMVIMSACETGTGEAVNGEGVYGLTRSFQVAGAKKILMSLWKVDDTATKDLMVAFYENLIEINDPQQALINAQKIVKDKFPEPYYWGAFVLVN